MLRNSATIQHYCTITEADTSRFSTSDQSKTTGKVWEPLGAGVPTLYLWTNACTGGIQGNRYSNLINGTKSGCTLLMGTDKHRLWRSYGMADGRGEIRIDA